MNRSLGQAAVAALLMVLLGACSGDARLAIESTEGPPSPSASVTATNPPGGLAQPVSIPGLSSDHLVLDESGAYFCLLRRSDDLAALRRQFNQPTG
jgi:hypothetical protein